MTPKELFNGNQDLARNIAMSFGKRLPKFVEKSDIRNEAMIGLWDAANKFKGCLGASFRTYAAIRINGTIGDWLRKVGGGRAAKGRTAKATALSRTVSLDDIAGRAQGGFLYGRDLLPDERSDGRPEWRLETAETGTALRSALPWRDRLVLVLYFLEGMTCLETGKTLGRSEAWAAKRIQYLLGELRDRAARMGMTA